MENTTTHIQKKNHLKTPWVQSTIAITVIFGTLTLFLLWLSVRNTILIENSFLNAPIANISPTIPGMLNALYVKEGDTVTANSQIALIGSEILYTKNGGIISSAPEVLGSFYAPGQTVISVVDNSQMKVIGSVDETKGLKNITPGERATFTVDAYPGKTYNGIVDEVSPVSVDTGVVFSISDNRPVKKFNIKVRFDDSKYPELKSGMSAKITVYANN